MRRLFWLAAVVIFARSTICVAQSPGDQMIRTAISLTPVGAFAPLATSTIENEVQHGVQLAIRYGYVPALTAVSTATNNGAATAIIPLAINSTASLTAGFFAPTCTHCDPGLMLSAGSDLRIAAVPFGNGGSRLTFNVNGEGGYGRPRDSFGSGSAWTLAFGIPVAWVLGGQARDAMRIVPYFTPSLVYGNIGTEGVGDFFPDFVGVPQSVSGWRGMVGGGIALFNRASSIALDIGFQFIAVPNEQPQVGAALRIGGR